MVAFIDQHRDAYGVEPICDVLPIAPSTYYEHRARVQDPDKRPDRAKRDEELRPEIQRVWDQNHAVYGAEKVWRQLGREHIPAARCTVERLMRGMGLRGAMVFEIGQDANAPSRPGTQNARNPQGDPMQSFDIAVKEEGKVVKSIEVTTVAKPVQNASELNEGVRHATDKVAGRIKDGNPIPGELEAEIQIDLFKGDESVGTGVATYDGTGNYTYKVNNGTITPKKFGQHPNPGNVFDDFARELPKVGNVDKLAAVTIVDASGNVIATFERQGTNWIWTNKPKGPP